jgi:mono/diheme cytochrome c family protein
MQLTRKIFMLLCLAMLVFFTRHFALAADEGQKVFHEACGSCHSAKLRPIDKTRLTKEQWKETIDRMIELGAEVPKGKMPELLDYLSRTHGPADAASDGEKK